MYSKCGRRKPQSLPNVHDCTAGTGYSGIFSANVTAGVCGRAWEMGEF